MAETVHLFLKANGADIQGESTQISLERENSIECLFFQHGVRAARDPASGMATGGCTFEPVTITKRIDKASPLIAKAIANSEKIDAEFRVYRPSRAGDGTTEHFFTVTGENGRISTHTQMSPDVTDPAAAYEEPTETVGLVFEALTWKHVLGGTEYRYNWKERA